MSNTLKYCCNQHHTGPRLISTELFNKRSSTKDGLNSWCRECCRVESRLLRERQAAEQGKQLKVNARKGTRSRVGGNKWMITTNEQRMKRSIMRIRHRCKKHNIPCTITITDLLPLPTHCPDLGIELIYISKKHAHNLATIDKIIPEKGYVPGNVRVVSYQANAMKQNATFAQLEFIAHRWIELVKNAKES